MTKPTAIDLFAGAGGATEGLKNAGFRVLGAVENDQDAAASFAANHPTTQLWEEDIRTVKAKPMRESLGLRQGELTLLKACPPCQGFSSLALGRGESDAARNDLVLTVSRFVRAFRPQAILLENVPGLGRDIRFSILKDEIRLLGYSLRTYVVEASKLGVPQRRRRIILIAVRGKVELPNAIEELVGDAFPMMSAGKAFAELQMRITDDDPLDWHRTLSPAVSARIAAIPVGGTRYDLPADLRLRCHDEIDAKGRRGAASSYGRVKLDLPSATMTTRCTTPACGAFIHPTENRGLTLREAAVLQTFPVTYRFEGTYGSIERQIGNAVPVRMAEILGTAVRTLVLTRSKKPAAYS